MSNLITARAGSEQHSSTWAKFRIVGLDMVKEESANYKKNQDYHDYSLEDPPDGTVFSIWCSSGNKRGTDIAEFRLCVIDSNVAPCTISDGHCHVTGKFTIVALGKSKTTATRLLEWWVDWAPKNGGQTLENAVSLGKQIHIRGRKEPKVE